MGKRRVDGEYNDFLDGEKLRDNANIRTTLHSSPSAARSLSPPATRQERKGRSRSAKAGPKRPQLTHFLCLPLVTPKSRPQLEQHLDALKGLLAADGGGVPLEAVRPVGSLHLTLGVMSLDAAQLDAALQHLHSLDLRAVLRDIGALRVAEQAAADGTVAENLNAAALPAAEALTVSLEKLVPMQTPRRTSILYAEPRDASARLAAFAERVRTGFARRGVLVEDRRPLRLHATLINTIYAKPKGRAGARGKQKTRKHGGSGAAADRTVPEEEAAAAAAANAEADGTDDASTAGSALDGDHGDAAAEHKAEKAEGHGPNAKSWMRFDATRLIEAHKAFSWADGVTIDRVQICKMGARKVLDDDGEVVDEQYEVVGERVM